MFHLKGISCRSVCVHLSLKNMDEIPSMPLTGCTALAPSAPPCGGDAAAPAPPELFEGRTRRRSGSRERHRIWLPGHGCSHLFLWPRSVPAAASAAARMIPPVQVSPLIKVRALGGSPGLCRGCGGAGQVARAGGPGRGAAGAGPAYGLSEGHVLVSASRSSPGTRRCSWG